MRGLAAALGVNMAAMFENTGEQSVVSPARAARSAAQTTNTLRSGDGVILERLVAERRRYPSCRPTSISSCRGGASDGLISHVGEEMGYLLEGKLELIVGGESFRARARRTVSTFARRRRTDIVISTSRSRVSSG